MTNPIDVTKVRLQLDNELVTTQYGYTKPSRYYNGFFHGGLRIFKEEGIRGLYKGIAASILREASYSTIRLGAYEPFKELLGAHNPAKTPLWKKIAAGALSGAIGSAIASPTDLVKIRLQAEGTLKPGEQPRYPSTFSAFKTIAAKEGVKGLWRGVGATVKRAAIVTGTQIPSYDHLKHSLLNYGLMSEGLRLHMVSSMGAGLAVALVSSPVDVIKTRLMNQKVVDKNGTLYRSAFECLGKTLRTEGLTGLYKGLLPNWLRAGPQTMITFCIFEQLRKIFDIAPV